MYSNTVYIRTTSNSCFQQKFDLTYPTRLNRIIAQDEFEESIRNINRKIAVSKRSIIICSFAVLTTIIGFVLLVITGQISLPENSSSKLNTTISSDRHAADRTSTNNAFRFQILVSVGSTMTIVGVSIIIATVCFIMLRHTNHMKRAIADESKKYSRSPIPCSWDLCVLNQRKVVYDARGTIKTEYYIVIKIGSVINSISENIINQMSTHELESTFDSPTTYEYDKLPEYRDLFTCNTCFHCEAPNIESNTNYCSVCSQISNNFWVGQKTRF